MTPPASSSDAAVDPPRESDQTPQKSASDPSPGAAHILIRPIAAQDRQALESAVGRLSEESRYRRFFTAAPELSSAQLDHLMDVDHHDHEALVAVDPTTGDILGVARFVRTGDYEAEPAIAIADDWQGHGLGSRMLKLLAERARDEGIRTFNARILADNVAVIGALERLGPMRIEGAGRESLVMIALADPTSSERSLRSLLRACAAGVIGPKSAWFGWLGSRTPDPDLRQGADPGA